jgi:hypothetical protein
MNMRPKPNRQSIFLCVFLILAVPIGSDTIVLEDGTRVDGKITFQNPQYVDIITPGSETSQRYDKLSIKSISYSYSEKELSGNTTANHLFIDPVLQSSMVPGLGLVTRGNYKTGGLYFFLVTGYLFQTNLEYQNYKKNKTLYMQNPALFVDLFSKNPESLLFYLDNAKAYQNYRTSFQNYNTNLSILLGVYIIQLLHTYIGCKNIETNKELSLEYRPNKFSIGEINQELFATYSFRF